jgi:asparagine synthase (glutamine-hydrolysing)
MCGIAGIYFFDNQSNLPLHKAERVKLLLKHRGPDFQKHEQIDNCHLFHTRLSIIDTTEASHQPFHKNNACLIFNGEIFNYKSLQNKYSNLQTSGDVEVLQEHLLNKNDLNELNGYFAFAFYNQQDKSLLLGRDRFGVKPLYFFHDEHLFAFASELKVLLELTGKQALNENQLYTYFRFNYCAGNQSIFENIYQLQPGTTLKIHNKKIEHKTWYQIQTPGSSSNLNDLMMDAVKLRLQADVPVGSFLSGGLDSSLISAIAAGFHKNIHTFSIGFKDETFFDESKYAAMVAKHIGSQHHEVKLSESDFAENIYPFLNSIDEPFADSSAFNVYMLSKYTKQHVKVALSGDGADELFKGYQKHKALYLTHSGSRKLISKAVYPIGKLLKESREGYMSNKWRQIKKFNHLIHLNDIEKLQFLSQISSHKEVSDLLASKADITYYNGLFKSTDVFSAFGVHSTFDIQTVLKDDMLVKADRYSMQHGLEIRNPFLDYRIVEFALHLSDHEKINRGGQKLILHKTFRSLLPEQIFERRKKGFELPLRKWMTSVLKHDIEHKWLERSFIEDQNLFNYQYIQLLKQKTFSPNPGDSAAKLWALIVFQNWYLQNNQYIR